MTETAPQALPPDVSELWHVDFHMAIEPSALAPSYIKCEVSRRAPGPDPKRWHMEGIASFDAPPVIIPRVGAELIPYLIYHLDEVKQWLIEEHVRRTFNGQTETIGPDVGVAVQPAGTVPVYDS